jgi:hypothetical protein
VIVGLQEDVCSLELIYTLGAKFIAGTTIFENPFSRTQHILQMFFEYDPSLICSSVQVWISLGALLVSSLAVVRSSLTGGNVVKE